MDEYKNPSWSIPRVGNLNCERVFCNSNRAKGYYGFIKNSVGKEYSNLSNFADQYFEKDKPGKYFGQITTTINYLGLLEIDNEDKVVENKLLNYIYDEINEKNNIILGHDYINYYLSNWQTPMPNFNHDRGKNISKPFLLIIQILLYLNIKDKKEAYLTLNDFYRLFSEPKIFNCEEVNEKYIADILENRDVNICNIDTKDLIGKLSYYTALLKESYILTTESSEYDNPENFMIGLSRSKKSITLAKWYIIKYKDIKFEFNRENSFKNKEDITNWARYINDFEKFINWEKEYHMINDVFEFREFCLNKGFYYSEDLIRRFILSLEAKPFLIITGISGSGKSKIAELWSEYKDPEKKRSLNIAVGSNWKDNKRLLGFKNILQQEGNNYIDTNLVKLIKEANSNEMETYTILFDEMNLSHVEHYFSDFLSALESRSHEINLPNDEKIIWSSNIKIIGTVNIDETTYMFSPKVLDRANVIEMNGTSPIIYIKSILKEKNKPYYEIKDKKWFDEYINLLEGIYIALNKNFAYRVIDEITIYIKLNTELFGNEEFNKYFDEQIYQKILPKLHGSKALLKPQLEKLKIILNEKDETAYKYSLKKINEMLTDIQQGYASFNRR